MRKELRVSPSQKESQYINKLQSSPKDGGFNSDFPSRERRREDLKPLNFSRISPGLPLQARYSTPNRNSSMHEKPRAHIKPPVPSTKELKERSRRIGRPPLRGGKLGTKLSKTLNKSDETRTDPMLKMFQRFKKSLNLNSPQDNPSSLPDIHLRTSFSQNLSYEEYSKLRKKGWDGSLSHKLFSALEKQERVKKYAQSTIKNHTPHQSKMKKMELKNRIRILKEAQMNKPPQRFKLQQFKRVKLDQLSEIKSGDLKLKIV